MIEAINPQTGPRGVEPTSRTRRPDSAPSSDGRYTVPASPPEDVLEALDRAAQVLDELAARDVQLQFDVDESSGRIEVAVIDGSGNVIRRIPPHEALDLLAGEGAGLVLNETG